MIKYLKPFIRRYFKSFLYFYRRLGNKLFIGMVLSISVGVLDGFGLAMFLPLLQMTQDASTVNPEGLGKLSFLLEGMQNIGLNVTLITILLMMSLFFILKGVAQYSSKIYHINLRQFFIKTIRVNLSNALSRMSYKSFVTSNAGRIQNTMSGEVSRISKAYQSYSGTFQEAVMVTVYMTFAFFIDAQFALLICIGGGLTNFIYKRIYKSTKISSKKLTKGSNLYQGLILQFVSYFKYLKATGNLRIYNDKLLHSIEYIEENNRKIGQLGSIVTSIREPVLVIVVSLVIIIQINLLAGSLGTILVSLLFFYRALSSLMLMQTHYNDFLAVSGSMDNMTSFENDLEKSRESEGKLKIEKLKTCIELKEVDFFYGEISILKKINLKVLKNQTIAFVGESGSGKTTLLNILAGLVPVNCGEMLIDGINSKELNLISYQKRIGYITQDPVIFNDTVYNNISFWAEPTPDNRAKFDWAIQQASLKEFIEELPKKENTNLGHSGINLSGGQKQRISIARELYKDVDILFLDEATSALDSETEEVIQRGLEHLKGKYTILIVAHRLSTIKNADHILVLERGMITDEGNFNELVSKSAKFQRLVELQEV